MSAPEDQIRGRWEGREKSSPVADVLQHLVFWRELLGADWFDSRLRQFQETLEAHRAGAKQAFLQRNPQVEPEPQSHPIIERAAHLPSIIARFPAGAMNDEVRQVLHTDMWTDAVRRASPLPGFERIVPMLRRDAEFLAAFSECLAAVTLASHGVNVEFVETGERRSADLFCRVPEGNAFRVECKRVVQTAEEERTLRILPHLRNSALRIAIAKQWDTRLAFVYDSAPTEDRFHADAQAVETAVAPLERIPESWLALDVASLGLRSAYLASGYSLDVPADVAARIDREALRSHLEGWDNLPPDFEIDQLRRSSMIVGLVSTQYGIVRVRALGTGFLRVEETGDIVRTAVSRFRDGAGQLAEQEPGIVFLLVIERTSEEVGQIVEAIDQEFAPGLYSRVSLVVVMEIQTEVEPQPTAERPRHRFMVVRWQPHLVMNPHASQPFPVLRAGS